MWCIQNLSVSRKKYSVTNIVEMLLSLTSVKSDFSVTIT